MFFLLIMLAQFDTKFWNLREALSPNDRLFNAVGKNAAERRERQQLERRLDEQDERIKQLERRDDDR